MVVGMPPPTARTDVSVVLRSASGTAPGFAIPETSETELALPDAKCNCTWAVGMMLRSFAWIACRASSGVILAT